MPTFQYQALTESGELVNGHIVAANAAEVAHRIDYLRLVPIDIVRGASSRRSLLPGLSWKRRGPAGGSTTLSFCLSLFLRACGRARHPLRVLSRGPLIGRLRSTGSGGRGARHLA